MNVNYKKSSVMLNFLPSNVINVTRGNFFSKFKNKKKLHLDILITTDSKARELPSLFVG